MTTSLISEAVVLGGKTILQPIDLSIEPNELICLVGPNGAGKSTWLKVIAGLVPGLISSPEQNAKTRAKTVSYLAQTPIAPPRSTTAQIIALGRTPYLGPMGRLSKQDTKIVNAAIDKCDLQHFRDRQYATLSGGEQMRVHLARAFATQAKLLLADEPITGLDPQYQLGMMTHLRDYARDGHTVITALHDLTLARQFADRILVLEAGKLVKNGPPHMALSDEVIADVFKIRLGETGLSLA